MGDDLAKESEEIREFVMKYVLAEREACIRVIEEHVRRDNVHPEAFEMIAAAIRGRK